MQHSNGKALAGGRGQKFQGLCQEGAIEGALWAAARDYQKEMGMDPGAQENQDPDVDIDDLLDDPDLERIHAERLRKLRVEQEELSEKRSKGHGEYREIGEEDFLKEVCSTDKVVVHFYHADFTRCKIIDKHLDIICKQHVEAKILKCNAEKAPFFVTKLGIKMLPAVMMFVDGVCKDRVAGFEELGGRDDFPTSRLERRLAEGGVLKLKEGFDSEDEDEREEVEQRRMVKSVVARSTNDDDDDW